MRSRHESVRSHVAREHEACSRREVLALFVALPPALWLTGCASRESQGAAGSNFGPTLPGADPGAAPGTDGGPPAPGTDGGLPASYVEISVEGDNRIVRSNGIPNHATGTFPNAHDPEALRPQSYEFRMPASPAKAASTTDLCPLGKQTYRFGVAINGVSFDPSGPWYHGGAEYDWHFEATSAVAAPALGIDQNNAHTQAGGQYHYHGVPDGLLEVLRADKPSGMLLLGYAADGFPVYASEIPRDASNASSPLVEARPSFRLRQGTRPTEPGGPFDGTFEQDYEYVPGLGDLDECNGREGPTPEYPNGTYYYVITSQYPYIPRQFRGTPDASFFYGPTGNATEPGGAGAPLPPELAHYQPK